MLPVSQATDCHILSWTTSRHLSTPKPVIRRFTLTARTPEARLRPISIGTSYHPDSMGFLPLATSYRNGCTQHPYRPPRSFTSASPYSWLDRLASGSIQVTSGAVHTSPLASCGLFAFALTLISLLKCTPWPVIQNG